MIFYLGETLQNKRKEKGNTRERKPKKEMREYLKVVSGKKKFLLFISLMYIYNSLRNMGRIGDGRREGNGRKRKREGHGGEVKAKRRRKITYKIA